MYILTYMYGVFFFSFQKCVYILSTKKYSHKSQDFGREKNNGLSKCQDTAVVVDHDNNYNTRVGRNNILNIMVIVLHLLPDSLFIHNYMFFIFIIGISGFF